MVCRASGRRGRVSCWRGFLRREGRRLRRREGRRLGSRRVLYRVGRMVNLRCARFEIVAFRANDKRGFSVIHLFSCIHEKRCICACDVSMTATAKNSTSASVPTCFVYLDSFFFVPFSPFNLLLRKGSKLMANTANRWLQ